MNTENSHIGKEEERLYAIWLSERRNLSLRLRTALTEESISPTELYRMGKAEILGRLGASGRELSSLLDKDLASARETLAKCERQGISLITYADAAYPEKLLNIPDFPLVLFLKGSLPDTETHSVIGVVGTRQATRQGMKLSEDFGRAFAEAGCIVCTGLADGVDSEAARGAIKAGGTVIGVLGTAIDKIFPAHNRELFMRLVSSGGCLVSETGPGLTAGKFMFPRRNRIIAGLSDAVVVTEAPKKSGALITAERAAEYGRDVFAVPAAPGNEAGEGCNALIKDGAGLAVCPEDVLSAIGNMYPERISAKTEKKAPSPKREKATEGFSGKETASASEQRARSLLESLSENALKVLSAIERPGMLLDEIIEGCSLSPLEITKELTMLQLKGIVRQEPGKRFSVNI